MDFVEIDGQQFIHMYGHKVPVEWDTAPDPEQLGRELPDIISTLVHNEECTFKVFFCGDNKFLLHASGGDENFQASFAEIRQDEVGMTLPCPIPNVSGKSAFPLLTAKDFGGKLALHFHLFDDPFTSVTDLLLDSMHRTLEGKEDSPH